MINWRSPNECIEHYRPNQSTHIPNAKIMFGGRILDQNELIVGTDKVQAQTYSCVNLSLLSESSIAKLCSETIKQFVSHQSPNLQQDRDNAPILAFADLHQPTQQSLLTELTNLSAIIALNPKYCFIDLVAKRYLNLGMYFDRDNNLQLFQTNHPSLITVQFTAQHLNSGHYKIDGGEICTGHYTRLAHLFNLAVTSQLLPKLSNHY